MTLTKDQFAGILRAVLAAAGGAIVASGWFDAVQWAEISGAATVVAVAVWSHQSKK